MHSNLDESCRLFASQRLLLGLTQKGITRENAYRLVQSHAMHAWKEKVDFIDLVKQDKDITCHFSETALDEMGDVDLHLQHVDKIFERVFEPDGA
jgi:adenylosuccinate lyase